MEWSVAVAAGAVGVLVGVTGTGGGALLTPMLVWWFSKSAGSAIASDLVASLCMRPIGAAAHLKRRTARLDIAAWLVAGAVPATLAGTAVLSRSRSAHAADASLQGALGVALLVATAAMVVRRLVAAHPAHSAQRPDVAPPAPRRLATMGVGIAGGFLVGLTSVGAGSLVVAALLWLYPDLGLAEVVGTDLVAALAISAAGAAGAATFGHLDVALTSSLVVGSVVGVTAGVLVAPRVPDRAVRSLIAVLVGAAGMREVVVAVGGGALWVLPVLGTSVAALTAWGVRRRSALARCGPAAGERAPVMAAPRPAEAVE